MIKTKKNNNNFKVSNGARSLMTTDISCCQMKQITIICVAGVRLDSSCLPPLSTIPHGGDIERLWGKRRGLKLSAESPIVPLQDTYTSTSFTHVWGTFVVVIIISTALFHHIFHLRSKFINPPVLSGLVMKTSLQSQASAQRTFGQRSIQYHTPLAWNSFPAHIRNTTTLSAFKPQQLCRNPCPFYKRGLSSNDHTSL